MIGFNRADHMRKIRKAYMTTMPPPSVRFWKFVKKTDTCWLWTGGTFTNGYGAFQVKRKTIRAHRFSWELANGQIPEGMDVLHSCDVPRCVRPGDLFLGTQLDNVKDRVAKGRSATGEQSGTSKLKVSQVKEIRKRLAQGWTQRDIAKLFNVCKSTIGNISRGENWKNAGGVK